MRVVIAGGGTAGHVNPAIALASALEGADVAFVGTATGAEATLVPRAGFALETVDVRGFDRGRPASLVATGVRAAKAAGDARRRLKGLGPDVVVGMGGYVSLPVCLAAASRRTPVVLHEQNIVLGLANRVCKPVAKRIGVSFEETLTAAGRRGVLVGNPVRRDIAEIDKQADRKRGYESFDLDPGRSTVLVFGGSQGAQRINQAAIGLASAWAGRHDVQVLHIAGRVEAASLVEQARQRLGSGRLIYRVVGYVERMAEAYAVADVALCRGGATTVAELGVVGLPSVIVPYPYHRDKQQERHGRVLEGAGAAVVLADERTTSESVAAELHRLLDDASLLADMRNAALRMGRPDAADRLAEVVVEAAR
jgi:UDP-N-acetylglucosamine--N-acetylmuramyl-(pentapeptide) pyrophosphoryl-undecaprenol N-acetylglucosamine transferase